MTEAGIAIVVTVGLALVGALAAIWGKLRAIETEVKGIHTNCIQEQERHLRACQRMDEHGKLLKDLEIRLAGGGE